MYRMLQPAFLSAQISVVLLAFLVQPAAVAQRRPSRGSRVDVWKALAAKHDANQDNRITVEEYTRGEERFRTLDRNSDGALTVEDFEQTGRGGMSTGWMARRIARVADADHDGKVTQDEWKQFLDSLKVDEQGVLDAQQLGASLSMGGGGGSAPVRGGGAAGGRGGLPPNMLQSLDRDGDGRLQREDIASIFGQLDADASGVIESGELGSTVRTASSAPQQGDAAPDFELPYADDKAKTVRLSSFAGKRPVALVFGSYT